VARTFQSDRVWHFAVPPDRLWDRLRAVEEYPSWWPWLRRFHAADGFESGSSWRCVVAPPLPYVVRFTVALDRVEPPERVAATVDGDIRGTAELLVREEPEGSSVRLRSGLAPADPVMRRFAAFAPALVGWGHDWVLDQGGRQFRHRALESLDR